jgi:hypothetical protein
MKSELRKRLILLFNFEDDPDGVGYALDLVDDVVLAEHISGLTGSGAVDLDNIPDGTTYQRVSVDYADADGKVDSFKEQNGARLLCKVIDIGDWNMDTTASVAVDHEIADISDIRSISAMIRNDGGTVVHSLKSIVAGEGMGYPDGYILAVSTTQITLGRTLGGYFDNDNFDSTSYSRGKITIWYEA